MLRKKRGRGARSQDAEAMRSAWISATNARKGVLLVGRKRRIHSLVRQIGALEKRASNKEWMSPTDANARFPR